MEGSKTNKELRTELIGKAAADDGYRARLVEDPKAAIKEALGIQLPESLAVHVHEETPQTAHLVLPPRESLTEAELESVTGGHQSGGIYDGEPREHWHTYLDGSTSPKHT